MIVRPRVLPALILSLLTAGSVALPASAQTQPAAPAAITAEDTLLTRLKAIPGLSVVSETQPTGYRFFNLSLIQPVDHRDPRRGTYQQRFTLLHRSDDAPVVLFTGGYGLAVNPTASR